MDGWLHFLGRSISALHHHIGGSQAVLYNHIHHCLQTISYIADFCITF